MPARLTRARDSYPVTAGSCWMTPGKSSWSTAGSDGVPRAAAQTGTCSVMDTTTNPPCGSLTKVGGVIPLPRRYVLGAWYSRYWPYSSRDYREIVNGYRENDFPLDIMVMDMDWHTQEGEAMRTAFHLRSVLFPCIYSSVRQSYRETLPLLRPMYLEYPREEEAYRNAQQYLFGDTFLVAPIVSPGVGPNKIARKRSGSRKESGTTGLAARDIREAGRLS